MLFHMVASVLLSMVAFSTIFLLVKILQQPIRIFEISNRACVIFCSQVVDFSQAVLHEVVFHAPHNVPLVDCHVPIAVSPGLLVPETWKIKFKSVQ